MWYNSFDILKLKDFFNMVNKFQIGNRVHLLRDAEVIQLFNAGDIGTVKDIRESNGVLTGKYSYYIYIERIGTSWWLPESWLEPENQIMVFE